jgi:hypothetical protein
MSACFLGDDARVGGRGRIRCRTSAFGVTKDMQEAVFDQRHPLGFVNQYGAEACVDVTRRATQIAGVRLRSCMSTDRRIQPPFRGGMTGGIGESGRFY